MAFDYAARSLTVTDTFASESLGGHYRSGFIYNTGGTACTVYINQSSAVSTKAIAIPAGLQWSLDPISDGTIYSFGHKVASGSTTISYEFHN